MENILKGNIELLSEKEKELCQLLIENGQEHLFTRWDPPGINDQGKHQLLQQLQSLHESYLPNQGGLIKYIHNAQKLLNDSMNGVNPLEGWIPSIPSVGVNIEPITEEYHHYDTIGINEIHQIGFILVAGGLGERLGYSDIKIALPTETLTGRCYIELYCQQILQIQQKYLNNKNNKNTLIPFAIMLSDDTYQKTIELFQKNSYFGLSSDQIYFMKQDKVAALLDNNAKIALNDTNIYEINCKPHGHGDVHALLYQTGIAKHWYQLGIKWLFFFQDTNALAFTSLSAMLGVSIEKNLHLNSRAIPRYAKQAIGALVRLTNGMNGKEMTVNVEYNLLDPLLRSTISSEGDINDPITGQSVFPGNINQLLIHLEDYLKVLEKTHGIMNEFVNPKYLDESRIIFKKPTRLECMMQDYSYGLQGSSETENHEDDSANSASSPSTSASTWNHRVGYTLSPGWSCYSPVKNHVNDACIALKKGIPPACAMTGEVDLYFMWRELLRKLGCDISEGPTLTFQGITGILSPQIIFHPSFILFPLDLTIRFPYPPNIRISNRSSLIIEGNVIIESLYLDGACRILNKSSCKTLRIIISEEKSLINDGYDIISTSTSSSSGSTSDPIPQSHEWSEIIQMRGFYYKKNDEFLIELSDDSPIEGNYSFYEGKNDEVVYHLK